MGKKGESKWDGTQVVHIHVTPYDYPRFKQAAGQKAMHLGPWIVYACRRALANEKKRRSYAKRVYEGLSEAEALAAVKQNKAEFGRQRAAQNFASTKKPEGPCPGCGSAVYDQIFCEDCGYVRPSSKRKKRKINHGGMKLDADQKQFSAELTAERKAKHERPKKIDVVSPAFRRRKAEAARLEAEIAAARAGVEVVVEE